MTPTDPTPDAPLTARIRHLVDTWWDPATGLLGNPAGTHDGEVHPAGTLQLVPASAWYAHGLLASGAPQDRDRAVQVLERLAALQYDASGQPWDGTWPIHANIPAPGPERDRLGTDWDPNLRQLVGATLALILADHAPSLPAALRPRLATAVARAVTTEDPDRVRPESTSIAILKAWLDAHVGTLARDESAHTRGQQLAAAIAARHARFGGFDEFPSPTGDGITLWGLSLWAALPPTDAFESAGRGLRAAVWYDLAARWHPRLHNVAGPYTRAYANDARRSVAAVNLWVAAATDDPAALPPLVVDDSLDHGHDLPLWFLVERLTDALPESTVAALHRIGGTVRPVGLPERRRLTAWLGEGLALGAERSPAPVRDRPLAVPALAHWPGRTGTAWLAARPTAPLEAVVRPARLLLRAFERSGGLDAELDPAGADVTVTGRRIVCGDATVEVDADVDVWLDEVAGRWRLRFDVAPGDTVTLQWEG